MRDSEIYMKVHDFVVANRLLEGTHRVITGFSGGADSVCLLFILKALQKEEDLPDFSLVAMHIHHGIRGDEADRDAAFAKDFCKKLDIDYIENHIDVPAAAKETGESEEMAGRRLRYEMFRKEACEGTRIATAHHKNDSAETVLMNIARGTGLSGLAGIKCRTRDLIRPLLCLTRKEIEHFVYENELDFVTDSTNAQNIYTRNFVRNEIVPLFEQRLNPAFTDHIEGLSGIARRADEYFKAMARNMYRECRDEKSGVFVPDSILKENAGEENRILREYLYMLCFTNTAGTAADLTAERIDALDDLKMTGKLIELPHKVRVLRKNNGIFFLRPENDVFVGDTENSCGPDSEKETETELFDESICKKLEAGETVEIDAHNVKLSMSIVKNYGKSENSDYTKYFDYDKMKGSVCLRKRKAGDFIVVTKDGGRRKLKSELIDRKIPAEDRDSIPVLARGSECLWAVGVRQGMSVLVGELSKRILCIEVR